MIIYVYSGDKCLQTCNTTCEVPTKKKAELEDMPDQIIQLTEEFIEYFLDPTPDPGERVSFESIWHEYTLVDKAQVVCAAKKLEYSEFLQTIYWKVIADHVRREHGYLCAVCPSEDRLEVHHRRGYHNHGREIEVWKDELIPLCKSCHAKYHNKTADEQEQERRDKFRRGRKIRIKPSTITDDDVRFND